MELDDEWRVARRYFSQASMQKLKGPEPLLPATPAPLRLAPVRWRGRASQRDWIGDCLKSRLRKRHQNYTTLWDSNCPPAIGGLRITVNAGLRFLTSFWSVAWSWRLRWWCMDLSNIGLDGTEAWSNSDDGLE
jgi:hypothetical protein